MAEPTPSDTDPLLTPAEVCQKLKRSEGWLRRKTAEGLITSYDVGTPKRPAPRYKAEDIEAYLDGIKRPAVVPANPYGRRRRGQAA